MSDLRRHLNNLNFDLNKNPSNGKDLKSRVTKKTADRVVLKLTGIKTWNNFSGWFGDNFSYDNASKAEEIFNVANVVGNQGKFIEFSGDIGGCEDIFVDGISKSLGNINPKTTKSAPDRYGIQNSRDLPQNAFDIIDGTPLLYSSDWRLGLARLLRMLKPDGYLLLPNFRKDFLLIDGEIARWNGEKHKDKRKETFLHQVFTWLFLEIERKCNRPWIPETSICKPHALCQFSKHVLDYDRKSNEAIVFTKDDIELEFTGEWIAENFLKFHPFRSLVSPIELEKIEKSLIGFLSGKPSQRASDKFIFDINWVAIKFNQESLNVNKINDAAIISLASGERYLIDSEHHLLPEINQLEKSVDSEDQKILRSVRGFVSRMLQHDRFDPEHHQLFAVTLWMPKKDSGNPELNYNFSEGEFRGITGYVYRSNQTAEEKLDQILRNITYLAHAYHNGTTLQSIPQSLFDSDRPIIRVIIGERDFWDYEIRGYSQPDFYVPIEADAEIELDEIYKSAGVPTEITFYVPHFDKENIHWKSFREKYIDDLLNRHTEFKEQLEKENWETNVNNLSSFPWNFAKAKEIGGNIIAGVTEGRGIAAGLLTQEILKIFNSPNSSNEWENLWVEEIIEDADISDAFGEFNKKLNALFDDLHLDRTKIKKEIRERWFYVFLSLCLVFPKYNEEENWELRQIPVGAFVNDETNLAKKFVSAGSALLISKLRSEEQAITKDVALRQDLAEIRSTQLLKRVPGVLLPISLMVYTRLFNEETIKYATRAAISQVMARNMSHNVASHVLSKYKSTEDFKGLEYYVFPIGQYDQEESATIPRRQYKAETLKFKPIVRCENCQDKINANENPEEWFDCDNGCKTLTAENLRNYFNEYLKNRMDFLADIATIEQATLETALNFKADILSAFDKNRILLNRISGLDSDIKFDILFKSQNGSDVLVSVPNDILGNQAFYIILENVIRNICKHTKSDFTFEREFNITIEIREYEHNSRFYEVQIFDDIRDTLTKITELAEKRNATFDANIVNPVSGKLRDDGLGSIEMKVCASYLRKEKLVNVEKSTYKINSDGYVREGNENIPNFIYAYPHDWGGNDTNKQFSLGYKLYFRKPESLLIFAEDKLGKSEKELETLSATGISILRRNELDKNTEYGHDFVIWFGEKFQDFYKKHKTSLPIRLLEGNKLGADFLGDNNVLEARKVAWKYYAKTNFNQSYEITRKNKFRPAFQNDKNDSDITKKIFIDDHSRNWDRFNKNEPIAEVKYDYYDLCCSHHRIADERLMDISRKVIESSKYIESVETKIVLIDERIQSNIVISQKKYGENLVFEDYFYKAGVFIPTTKQADLNERYFGSLQETEDRNSAIGWKLKNYLTEEMFKNEKIDFCIIHLGIIEKLFSDKEVKTSENIAKKLKRLVGVENLNKMIVTSGRGKSTNLSDDFRFIPLAVVQNYVETLFDKFQLVTAIYNSRRSK